MKKTVIFLAFANDKTDASRYLRNLSNEFDEIRDILDKTNCKIIERANVQIKDIFKIFRENEVTIFHYAGHANDFQLLLESQQGNEVAHGKYLMDFLSSQSSLKLVFLNGCSTQYQIQQLQKNIPAVIGTRSEIDDEIAKKLAVRFYQNLAHFKTVETSWNMACSELKTKHGTDFRALYRPDKFQEQKDFPWELIASEKGKNWKLKKPFPKWITSVILTVLVLGLGYQIFQIANPEPFDFRIKVKDLAPNSNLPFEEATVILKLNHKAETLRFSPKKEAIFQQIPSSFHGEKVPFIFEAKGFQEIDSQFVLENNFAEIEIQRNNQFGKVFGTILDENGNPFPNIKVSVLDVDTLTDKHGNFEFYIPLEKQQTQYNIILQKDGFDVGRINATPSVKAKTIFQ